MFKGFGEVDSYEELNRMAQAQWKEGDDEALHAIAKENGIPEEDVEDFIEGMIDELCTPMSAAIGKLQVEAEHLKVTGSIMDWVEELQSRAVEDMEFAKAVRRKGKTLAGFIARGLDHGWNHSWDVSKEVMEETKDLKKIMHGHMCKVGLPDRKTRKKIATQYYMEG